MGRFRIFLGCGLGALVACSSATPSHPPLLGAEDAAVRDASSAEVGSDAGLGGPGIVSDGTDGNPVCVTTDASFVYWTVKDGRVFRRAKAGGAIELLATGIDSANAIVVSDGFVYWHAGDYANGVLSRVPIAGGEIVAIAKMRPMVDACRALAADANQLYFADVGDKPPDDGSIFALPKSGGTPTPIATKVRSPGNLAVDDANVYFVAEGTPWDFLDAIVAKVPKGGGSVVPLTGPQKEIGELTLDASFVYFTGIDFMGGNRGIHAVSKAGGNVTSVLGDTVYQPIVRDGSFLYFGGGGLARVTTSGKSYATLDDLVIPTSLAVDASGVYAVHHTETLASVVERYAK